MTNAEIYRERETEDRASAEKAQLPNVKRRFLESAEVWRVMADRAERLAQDRQEPPAPVLLPS